MDWSDLLQLNDGVATVAELVAAGTSRHLLSRRIRGCAWQRVLPGVIVAHSGPVSTTQRLRAAVLYGGDNAVLSHGTAGALHGMRVSESIVSVTIPHGRRRQDVNFVRLYQSSRPFRAVWRDALPCTGPARTVVDIAAQMRRITDVRALVSDAVQRRIATVAEIASEGLLAPKRGSALLIQSLEEVQKGARSAGEAAFLRLLHQAGIPEPEFNAEIDVPGGRYVVDALWRDVAVIVEIDGMAWHLDGGRWQEDLVRQNTLHAAGFLVIRFPPSRIRRDPDGVIHELRAVLRVRGMSLR